MRDLSLDELNHVYGGCVSICVEKCNETNHGQEKKECRETNHGQEKKECNETHQNCRA